MPPAALRDRFSQRKNPRFTSLPAAETYPAPLVPARHRDPDFVAGKRIVLFLERPHWATPWAVKGLAQIAARAAQVTPRCAPVPASNRLSIASTTARSFAIRRNDGTASTDHSVSIPAAPQKKKKNLGTVLPSHR